MQKLYAGALREQHCRKVRERASPHRSKGHLIRLRFGQGNKFRDAADVGLGIDDQDDSDIAEQRDWRKVFAEMS